MTSITDLQTFVQAVLDRVVAMEEAVVQNSKAVDYASFNYGYGPLYWTNRIEAITPSEKFGVDEFSFLVPIAMRLHSGFLTKGFPGRLEQDIQRVHVPAVVAYFWARRDLVYAATSTGSTRIAWYDDDGFDFSCLSALAIFGEEESKQMLGAEFRLTTRARIRIERDL